MESQNEQARMGADQQLFIMLWANILLFILVFLTLLLGYRHARSTPWPWPGFWAIGGALIALNFVGGFPEWFSIYRINAKVRNRPWKPGSGITSWKERSNQPPLKLRDLGTTMGLKSFWSVRGVTWLSALLAFVAMWILVDGTGGGLESPYSPLLLGPAILGPIVVMDGRSLIPLGLLGIALVLGTDADSSKTTDISRPGWLVYSLVSLFLVTWVIYITTVLLTGDTPSSLTPRQDVELAGAPAELDDGISHETRDPSASDGL